MPWTVNQVDGFKKGLTDQQKKKWVAVANGILKDCRGTRMDPKQCEAKAVRIANSKFESKVPFNPAFNKVDFHLHFNGAAGNGLPANAIPDTGMVDEMRVPPFDPDHDGDDDTVSDPNDIEDAAAAVSNDLWLTPDRAERLDAAVDECMEKGDSEDVCFNAIFDRMRRGINFEREARKIFSECSDCQNEMNMCQEKGMSESDCKAKVMADVRKKLSSKYSQLHTITEMEIFRAGTHNGDEFTEKDLEEMASNYKALKEDLRPKLKITHKEDEFQESLAGLASYGDVVDVFVKKVADGSKRLFAKLNRVPEEVYNWIKQGRFSERSIELYPEFKLGTKESPIYKNVLKSIALLGHQMPAVTGMAPIKLSENMECQGTMCLREKIYFEAVSKDTEASIKLFEKKLETESLMLSSKP